MSQPSLHTSISLLTAAKDAEDKISYFQGLVRNSVTNGTTGEKIDLEVLADLAKLMPQRAQTLVMEIVEERRRLREGKLDPLTSRFVSG